MKIQVKRAYAPATPEDGRRFLVERLWPRGVKKEALAIEAWLKDAAPSPALRQWFGHDPARWPEFLRRYGRELDNRPASWRPLLDAARQDTVTLIFSSRDTEHNAAIALRDYLARQVP